MGKRGLIVAALAAGLALAAAPAGAAGPPSVGALWVANVSATSAVLHAEVNPEGSPTGYRFEYLTEAAFQANLQAGREGFSGAARVPSIGEAALGSASTPQLVLQHVERLASGTAYRYRILATGAGEAQLSHVFTTQPATSFGAEECANAQLRFEDRSLGLPDCRAWEMVSPIDKNGGAIQGPGQNAGGDVLQAASSGQAATYSSSASFGEAPQGAPPASQYLSRRTPAGWQTENITAPTLAGAYGNAETGVPYQLFSADLSRGLLLNGRRCAEGAPCPRSYALRDDESGAFAPSPEAPDLRFAGAEPDLRHPIFSTCAALTTEATEVPSGEGCDFAQPNLYEWTEGQLELVNLLPGEAQGSPGAALAAQAGAVSTSGDRVYFEETSTGALYLREAGEATRLLPETAGGGATFQAASTDGSLAFFTKAGHLYRYDATTEATTDLTASGGVVGVLGASADGSAVYYQDAGGLFLWQAPGATTQVAPGAQAAQASDFPPATGTVRLSPDGTHLAFLSKASLTGYDNTDQGTGKLDSEAFLWSAADGLACVSCNPTGERPVGPSSIPGAIANGAVEGVVDSYKPRDLTAAGTRLFFDSADTILPSDVSAAADVYEWEAGGLGSCRGPAACVSLVSGGKSSEPSTFVDASEDGRDVFFLTTFSLLGRDPGSVDLYDAREGGGLPEPTRPTPCDGDACQSVPSPPEDPVPGTLVAGSPNPPVHFPKPRCPKGVSRHGHSACAHGTHGHNGKKKHRRDGRRERGAQ